MEMRRKRENKCAHLRATWFLVGVALSTVTACVDDAPSVEVRLVTAPGQEPYVDAIEIRIFVEDGDEVIASASYEPGTRRGVLDTVPFGSGLRIRAEVYKSVGEVETLRVRGWSFPFDIPNSDSPSVTAHVYMADLGQTVAPVPNSLGSNVGALAPTSGGALIATGDGLHLLTLHDDSADGGAKLERLERLSGAVYWASPSEGLMVHVTEDSAGLYDETGLVTSVDYRFDLAHGTPLRVLGIPQRREVWVMGGAGPPSGNITVISVEEDGPQMSLKLWPTIRRLPVEMSDLRAILVPIQRETEIDYRVLTLDQAPGDVSMTRAYLVNPNGGEAHGPFELTLDMRGAALAVLSPGQVVVAGGLHRPAEPPCPGEADGEDEASNRVRILQIEDTVKLADSPSALLFKPRTHAAAASFGDGLVYVGGGRAREAACAWSTVDQSELVDGRGGGVLHTVGAGTLSMQLPQATTLANRLVLIAGREGLAIYFPARGP